MHLMKVVRRTHLYAGLFMAPWVAMYGASALVFNHDAWFAAPARDSTRWVLDSEMTDPRALARSIVDQLNENDGAQPKKQSWRLDEARPPRFDGAVTLDSRGESGDGVLLSFEPMTAIGTSRREHARPAPQPPQVIELDSTVPQVLHSVLPQMISAAERADGSLRSLQFRNAQFPKLLFHIERGAEHRAVSFSSPSGETELVSEPPARPIRALEFLTSLHRSHGYPQETTRSGAYVATRTVRAYFVDGMAVLMCYWAVSGVAMWVQFRPLRRAGMIVVTTTVLLTAAVWGGMYEFFASAQ